MCTSTTTVNFSDLFAEFSKEVRRIHVTWLAWYRMFEDEDAPHDHHVFSNWNELWQHFAYSVLCEIVLSVVRLTDPDEMPAKNGPRQNVTVQRVLEAMDFDQRDNLRREAESASRIFKKEVDVAELKQVRNRIIGHNDLATMLGYEKVDSEIEHLRLAIEWLCTFQWRCESVAKGRVVDWSTPGSAVHRDQAIDREIECEVDDLIKQLMS